MVDTHRHVHGGGEGGTEEGAKQLVRNPHIDDDYTLPTLLRSRRRRRSRS